MIVSILLGLIAIKKSTVYVAVPDFARGSLKVSNSLKAES